MSEFTTKINRLLERLHHGIKQCNHIEDRASIIEEHFEKFNQSIKLLSRLIEISFILLLSSNKDKLFNNKNFQLTNLSDFEYYLKRKFINNNEKQEYIQAFILLQSSSDVFY